MCRPGPGCLCLPLRLVAGASGAWLVFLDDEGLGERLVDQCRGAGQAVACVRTGVRFAALDGHTYEIDPRSAADYDALIEALRAADMAPRRIVHLWSVGRSATDFARAQELGFYSVLYLTQALGRRSSGALIDLTIVGKPDACGDGRRRDRAGEITGPRPEPRHPAGVPVDSRGQRGRGAGDGRRPAPLADRLHAEVLARPAGDAVAYRGSQRWVKMFEPATLGGRGENGLRERGVYLITGGLGNIGLAIADRLARSGQSARVSCWRWLVPAAGRASHRSHSGARGDSAPKSWWPAPTCRTSSRCAP